MPAQHILGISAFYHDSAAALVSDGVIVAAAQEERFTRVRHDAAFPSRAIEFALKKAGITASQLSHVVFYDKPFRKFDRILETYLSFAPRGVASFRQALPVWLKEKLHLPREIRKNLAGYEGNLVFTEHHQAHAASAFFPSPFERAAVITCDGVGEWATTTWGEGIGNRLRLRQTISFPHSLGLLYSAFTYFTGFKVNSGEYKLMGLAPYGRPIYADLIRDKLIDLKADGSFRLDMDYFTYCDQLTMTGDKFAGLFGGPARKPESSITQREMDLAASIQQVTEEITLRMARHVHAQTGHAALCLAGGVALNCVANGRLLRESPFEKIWIQPAAGDAGAALGAALFVWHELLERPRPTTGEDAQRGSLLGPSYANDDIGAALDRVGARYHRMDDEPALLERVAGLLAENKVVGWFHGAMEFGPRALGSRSVIGDPRSPDMQATMNLKIKMRESFRPFAPCVLKDEAPKIFDVPDGYESPYMLMVAPIRDEHRRKLTPEEEAAMREPDLLKRVNVVRSNLPSITHVDYSARLQTVDERHGRFHRLMKAFHRQTGCPVVINTSFNIRGEPIVNTPEQAFTCFLHTGMDVLVVENHVLLKSEQDQKLSPENAEAYMSSFSLD